jgi:hypothetical protein
MNLLLFLYLFQRNAVTTARLQGLEQDLGLTDLHYEVILSILYVTYCPAQIPSNMFLNWVKRFSLTLSRCYPVGLILFLDRPCTSVDV